MQQDRKFLLLC